MSLVGKCVVLGLFAAMAAASADTAPVHPATAPAIAAMPAPKRVLVLYDEDKDNLPGLGSTDRSLRESFHSRLGKSVEIHSESLDLARASVPDHDANAAEYLLSKYAAAPPDLVVAVLEPSLDFVLRHSGRLFPGVPVVFVGVDATAVAGKALPPNVTGVLVKRDFSATMRDVLKLQPETHRAYVIVGASPFDKYLEGLVRRDLQAFEPRVAFEYVVGMEGDAILARVARLPPDSVILYVTILADARGQRVVPHDAVAAIAATANAPVYVFLDQYVGLGPVGGNVYSTDTLGDTVAQLGVQILDGAAPSSLAIAAPSAQLGMFDARAMKRWHLDPARLPPGSTIRNEESSIWQLYRWYIVGTLAVLLIQGALIAGLLLARTRQRRAEAQALRERDDLAHVLRVTTLSELTSSLAHEISQPLGSILLNAEAAMRYIQSRRDGNTRDVEEALGDIIASADHASHVVGQVRTLFRRTQLELIPVDVTTLVEDVVSLLHAAMLVEHIDIKITRDERVPEVFGDPVQLEQVLLNVVRNACDAIAEAKSGLRAITIHIHQSRPGHVAIEVMDSGVGAEDGMLQGMFDKFVTTKPSGLGMGLAISRSIIDAHGGLIWATRNADRGGLTMHIELVACTSDEAAPSGAGLTGAS